MILFLTDLIKTKSLAAHHVLSMHFISSMETNLYHRVGDNSIGLSSVTIGISAFTATPCELTETLFLLCSTRPADLLP